MEVGTEALAGADSFKDRSEKHEPGKKLSVIFLGVAERAAVLGQLGTYVPKVNIIGLKKTIVSFLYPIPLSNWSFCFAAVNINSNGPFELIMLSDEDQNFVNSMHIAVEEVSDPNSASELCKSPPMITSGEWELFAIKIPPESAIIPSPGHYKFFLKYQDGSKTEIGTLKCVLAEPAPLTAERVEAIKANPAATKAVRLTLGCQKCPSKLRVYAALDRMPKLEQESFEWYQNIGDSFICKCGATKMDTSSIKKNFYTLLGELRPPGRDGEEVSCIPMYEAGLVSNIHIRFTELIARNPREEDIQQFIQNNPVLLHQFAPEKLYHKPPILTFFNADFGIVSPRKELILVEIEKADTRLLKKDGGEAAPLTHAFDQVRSWLHTIDHHRAAVLASLGLSLESISSIRAVVIAGRDAGYNNDHLLRLKGSYRDRISLLTFDDLAVGLAVLVRNMIEF